MPVEEFTLRALQDCFRKRRGTGTEVIGSLAHIQSHSDLVGAAIMFGNVPFLERTSVGAGLPAMASPRYHLNYRGACIAGKPAPTWTESGQRTCISKGTNNKGANLHPPPVCPLIPAVLLRLRQHRGLARRRCHRQLRSPRRRTLHLLPALRLQLPTVPAHAPGRPVFHPWPA